MNNPVIKNAILLAVFALVCTLLVILTNVLTAPTIIKQQQVKLSQSLRELLPAKLVNQQLLNSCRLITYPQYLGDSQPHRRWIAYENNQPIAIIYQAIAPDGYNGAISLLVGVWKTGKVSGVRVISENETPGLGDNIETRKSHWVYEFNGKALHSDQDERWAVKKDGGMFDQFTGATITPRAVVNSVKRVLELNKHQYDAIVQSDQRCQGD
ncbi:electron transport complex subunit RsxG [Celerinatantimonas sp. YJH-8]|uniref:electron transport complex subunit RsxG n=1 Tax=Celerinatantimonas sp. YJH-8 TaxID=3228714 RepID=UPI0038C3C036